MANRIKTLRKILAIIAVIYRAIAAIVEAFNTDNPGHTELPLALKNNKKPKSS